MTTLNILNTQLQQKRLKTSRENQTMFCFNANIFIGQIQKVNVPNFMSLKPNSESDHFQTFFSEIKQITKKDFGGTDLKNWICSAALQKKKLTITTYYPLEMWRKQVQPALSLKHKLKGKSVICISPSLKQVLCFHSPKHQNCYSFISVGSILSIQHFIKRNQFKDRKEKFESRRKKGIKKTGGSDFSQNCFLNG